MLDHGQTDMTSAIRQRCTNPGCLVALVTIFYGVEPNIYRRVTAFCFFLIGKNMHQFTCSEEEATDIRELHRSPQNYGYSVWNFFP
jgi:hypothetical protein